MIRPCRMNPRILAYTSLEGEFDYNTTPLAPLGSLVTEGTTPDNRPSWAPHGSNVWLIGPAMEHYRCVTVYLPKT